MQVERCPDVLGYISLPDSTPQRHAAAIPGIKPLHLVCAIHTLDKRPSIFIRDKPIFLTERMLRKGYDCKVSFAQKKSLVVSLKGLGAR
jgi:hypothetical protein